MAFDTDNSTHKRNGGVRVLACRIWWFGLAALLVPAAVAWIFRGVGYALHCAPQAATCIPAPFTGMLGFALKGTLDLAWFVGATPPMTLGLTVFTGLAAVVAAHPARAAGTMFAAPLMALLLPVGLVGVSTYEGCIVNENGLGNCVLWGANMGMTFHRAAIAPELIYSYTPLAVSGALVAGFLGWIVLWGHRQMDKT